MIEDIAFSFAASLGTNDDQVRPLVGTRDLLDTLSQRGHLGVDPPEFFGQRALRDGGEILVGRCTCGTVGCDDVRATVEVSGDTVTWDVSPTGRYEFAQAQYLEAVDAAAQERRWESAERAAERLVESLDFSSRERAGYRFQWASARIKFCQMALSFDRDGSQVLVEIGWDGSDPEDARRRVGRWLAEEV